MLESIMRAIIWHLLLLTALFIETSGAAARPVVSFSPNWTPIFPGESVTLSCNVAPTAQGNLGYSWYCNGQRIHWNQKSLPILPGTEPHSGDYQCQLANYGKSDPMRLDIYIYNDPLILQAPPAVHEGDSLSLRCHSRPGYDTWNPVFYKDNKPIGSPVRGSELHIGRVDVTASGTYRCEKELHYCNYFNPCSIASSDERYILVSELFSTPQLKVRPDQVTEGDHMTITCDTELSPHRATTELQFAFYRNGHNVQGFSLSNQYGVPSAQLEHSGKYTCEVQTPTGSVRKTSSMAHIHIQELFSSPQIKVRPDQVKEGDHMTITCDTKLIPRRATTELQFAFYRNGHNVQGFSLSNQYGVPSAKLKDSGNYACKVKNPSRSVRKRSTMANIQIGELFTVPHIKVSSDQVIRGDHMTITCDTKLSPHRETTELQFAFYRNGHNVQGFSLSNQYGVPSAQLEDSGNYTCEVQTPTGSVRKTSSMAHMQIEEFFFGTQIKVSHYPVTEGDNVTITCDTKLNPRRATTELQFAFYRNGHNVQGFSLSNQYGVPSAQLEDSGNYTCEVQTPTDSVRKRSREAHIHIEGRHQIILWKNPLRLILSLFIFILTVCLLFYHIKTHGTRIIL
uniref:Ig-like domain-containing protein n=1 Tax=Xenopus tropicalis TaxID=8364 RepID=A0A6I8PTZ9_XENTR